MKIWNIGREMDRDFPVSIFVRGFHATIILPPSNRASRISSCAVMLIGGWYSSTKKTPKNRKQNVKWGKKRGWRMKTFRQDRWPEVSRLVGRYSPLFFFLPQIFRDMKKLFFPLVFSSFLFPLLPFHFVVF